MAPDPILEDIRAYLSKRFQVVVDEPTQSTNYYVFTVPIGGIPREIKFHPDSLDVVLNYLDNIDLAGDFEGANVEFDPYRPSNW